MKRLILVPMVASLALTGFSETPYLSENLAVWFRADRGLETNETGGVTAWRNQGTLGSALDVAPATAEMSGHVAYHADWSNGQPALAFDGSGYLTSAQTSNLGMTEGGAWFVVYQPKTAPNALNEAVFGLDESGARFGAFWLTYNTTRALRGYFFDSDNVGCDVSPVAAPQVLNETAWGTGADRRRYTMAGETASPWNSSSTTAPQTAKLNIGNMISSWMGSFNGDIAEVRVYNRPMTGTDRVRIQLELCARYGIAWKWYNQADAGIDQTALGWCANAAIFGSGPNWAVAEPSYPKVSTGGLELTVDKDLPDSGECHAYLTHNGAEGAARVWYMSGAQAIRSFPITLSFDNTATGYGDAVLYWKSAVDGVWSPVANCTRTITRERCAFSVPNWANGYYRVADTLVAHFVADKGVECNGSGYVTAWRNQGSLGAALDVFPTNTDENTHITLDPTAKNGQPGLVLDNGFLRTAAATTMDATAEGDTWFAVYDYRNDVLNATTRANMGILGHPHPSDGSRRCGAFFGTGTAGVNTYHYSFAEFGQVAQINARWQIISSTRWSSNDKTKNYMRAFTDGKKSSARTEWGATTPWSSPFFIGHIGIDWAKPLMGGVAEVRYYNRPMSGAARGLVEVELAAKYGISVLTAGLNGVPDANCLADADMIGAAQQAGSSDAGASGMKTACDSGELTLSFDVAPTWSEDTLTFVAHDAGTFAPEAARPPSDARSWFVSTETATHAFTLRFAAPVTVGNTYRLMYRATATAAWRTLDTVTATEADGVSFARAAGTLAKGYYTLAGAPGGMTIILR